MNNDNAARALQGLARTLKRAKHVQQIIAEAEKGDDSQREAQLKAWSEMPAAELQQKVADLEEAENVERANLAKMKERLELARIKTQSEILHDRSLTQFYEVEASRVTAKTRDIVQQVVDQVADDFGIAYPTVKFFTPATDAEAEVGTAFEGFRDDARLQGKAMHDGTIWIAAWLDLPTTLEVCSHELAHLFYGRDEVSADRFGKAWRAANEKAIADYLNHGIDRGFGEPQPRVTNPWIDPQLGIAPNGPLRPENLFDDSGGRYLG